MLPTPGRRRSIVTAWPSTECSPKPRVYSSSTAMMKPSGSPWPVVVLRMIVGNTIEAAVAVGQRFLPAPGRAIVRSRA